MVTLRNTKNRRQSFELPHSFVCSADECLCTKTEQQSRTLDPVTGEYGTRVEEVQFPCSIHLAARGTSKALPDGVLEVPAVAEAIRRGVLIAD